MNKVKRCISLFNDFFKKWINFSFLLSFYNLIWWICFYLRPTFALKLSKWAIYHKTIWFDNFFEKNYSDIIAKYKNACNNHIDTDSNYKIWVFWGQGEENMPPLVNACYRQLTFFNDNVVLLTINNICEYIKLKPIIYNKVRMGIISWANFSDIIRMALLSKYGGLWIDSTVWVTNSIPIDKLSNMPIFTPNGKIKQTKKSIQFWTSYEWNWSSWCLWANRPKLQLFSFVSDMLKAIGEREQCWPDYVIQDYLIYYACRFFADSKANMNKIQNITGTRRNDLSVMMNKPYNLEQYRELIKNDFLFKLSFRGDWKKVTLNGEQTFYGKIIENIIDIQK